MKLAIATPTYNEAGNIQKLLSEIQKSFIGNSSTDVTVFVIDDNSPDGTAKSARSWAKAHTTDTFHVRVLARKQKNGLGKAYVYAFNVILKQEFDYIIQMDADLSHDPNYLPELLEKSVESDFVVGSRYILGGATPDWTWDRKLLSRAGNLYTRFMLGSKITDYTGGYNLYSAELLRKINLEGLQDTGYGFLIELKYRALKECSSVDQVPIVFMDRRHGDSKIPDGIIFRNLALVARLKLADIRSSLARNKARSDLGVSLEQ